MLKFSHLPAPQQAGILSNERQFACFLAETFDYPIEHDSAVFIRGYCGVSSRRELATNSAAACKFAQLRTEYDAWRGKISRPDRRTA